MSWLAVWLVGVGLADLVRAGAGTSTTALRLAMGSGAAAVVVLAALTGLTAPIDLVCLAASLVPLVLWLWWSAEAVATGAGNWRALGSLAVGVGLAVGAAFATSDLISQPPHAAKQTLYNYGTNP